MLMIGITVFLPPRRGGACAHADGLSLPARAERLITLCDVIRLRYIERYGGIIYFLHFSHAAQSFSAFRRVIGHGVRLLFRSKIL